jgi:hypothetical protein
MGIFQDAVNALPSTITDEVEKVRALCDQITKEEDANIKTAFASYIEKIPRGPNIFLCLPVTPKFKKDIGALTLERELGNIYIVVLYTTKIKDGNFKKQKAWEIKENQPDKILTEYAKIYKYLEGK